MSHYYGTVKGRGDTKAVKQGTKQSGLTTQAASYSGAIETIIYRQADRDCYQVRRITWPDAKLIEVIAEGYLDTVAYELSE